MDGATANLESATRASQSYLDRHVPCLILFSLGGRATVTTALLPAQRFIARNTRGATSIVFSALGATLTAEVTWIGLTLTVGDGALQLLHALIPAGGVAAGIVSKSSRPRSAT